MSFFKVHIKPVHFELIHPFTISRGTRTHAENVLLSLDADGISVTTEAAPSARYQQSQKSVLQAVQQINWPDQFEPFDVEVIEAVCAQIHHDQTAARAMVECALLEWSAQKAGIPLWKYFGAASPIGPISSFTIGLDSFEKTKLKLQEAEKFKVLKVKLGGDEDKTRMEWIRTHTNQELWIDANESWKSAGEVLEMSIWMQSMGVNLIEQPLPAGRFLEWSSLKEKMPLPLIADEDFHNGSDLEELAKSYHGINIKLMKTGSLIRSIQYAKQAKRVGLKVLVGCMVESVLANRYGALISLFADYADLDGHLLLKPLPYSGMHLDNFCQVVVE